MPKFNIKTRFRTGTALILLLFCIGVSLIEYVYLKNLVIGNLDKETEIYTAAAEAIRTYVNDVSRPRITRLLPADAFIPEAMSTSFASREIMGRVREKFPEFTYKRAAENPRNPVNLADDFEREMLRWFNAHPETTQWSGRVRKGEHSYYARLMAIQAEPGCLACHGRPEDAPEALRALYGAERSFGYRAGSVVAADTVYIPMDVAISRIKEKAFWVFIMGVISLLTLFGLFFLLFNRTVVARLKGLLTTFEKIPGKALQLPETLPAQSADEVERLRSAFENVAAHLARVHGELKRSEAKYRRLFEANQDSVVICDTDTRITDINTACLTLFGLKDRYEALATESFHQFFWDAREAVRLFDTLQKAGYVREYEASMVDRTGNRMEVLITANLRQDDNRSPLGFVAVLRDVTAKRALEKQMARAEKMASIGQLAAGVAHEINNPLGVIQCYSGLIRKALPADSQLCADLQTIEKHTQQCKTVVESLLNFARISHPQTSAIDIQACVEEVLSVLERPFQKQQIVVRREFIPKVPPVTCDAQKMKQVFMNLLMNAIQAMPHGGRLTVRTRYQEQTGVVAIVIADTGCGVAEKNIERIFEPFFTTKSAVRGTGLGLAVSYGIVKQHGGEIQVRSAPGRGSAFTVLLNTENAEAEGLTA